MRFAQRFGWIVEHNEHFLVQKYPYLSQDNFLTYIVGHINSNRYHGLHTLVCQLAEAKWLLHARVELPVPFETLPPFVTPDNEHRMRLEIFEESSNYLCQMLRRLDAVYHRMQHLPSDATIIEG